MKARHQSNLISHLKTKHFWIDLIILACLWTLTKVIPTEVLILKSIPIYNILKIISLVATLEMFSFLTFHTLKKQTGIIVQGFLGGFISSTGTFLRLTRDSVYNNVPSLQIELALISTTCSMLLEAIFLSFALNRSLFFEIARPIFIILFSFALIGILKIIKKKRDTSQSNFEYNIDDPINWKNVLKLTLIIISLIFATRFINQYSKLPIYISSCIISLFEAHGVLAALLTEYSDIKLISSSVMAILFGGLFSKIIIIFRGTNQSVKKKFILIYLFAYLMACIDFYFIR